MTGNVALDVVIGLVFVYLLYSLYAMVIMEIVSSFFGLRARNLFYALRRMLMDERTYPRFTMVVMGREIKISIQEQLARLVTSFIQVSGLEINLKNDTLYHRFVGQPSIKYLGSGGVSKRPSYLTAENFSSSIIDALRGDDDEGGALAGIQAGLEMLPEDSETRKHIEILLRTANYDLVKFKLLLERWFNETMERSIGWYKRSTQIILIITGILLVVAFNVDSLAIIRKLSNDPEARDQLVSMAINFQEKNSELISMVREKSDSMAVKELNERLDSLSRIREVLKDDIRKSQSILETNWHLPESIPVFRTWDFEKKLRDSVVLKYKPSGNGSIFLVVHSSVDTALLRASLPACIKEDAKTIPVGKFKYKRQYVWDNLWGYLFTVLAISLGSPFWFDLLNKLIKLRTSKSVPTESDKETGSFASNTSKSDSLNRLG